MKTKQIACKKCQGTEFKKGNGCIQVESNDDGHIEFFHKKCFEIKNDVKTVADLKNIFKSLSIEKIEECIKRGEANKLAGWVLVYENEDCTQSIICHPIDVSISAIEEYIENDADQNFQSEGDWKLRKMYNDYKELDFTLEKKVKANILGYVKGVKK